jgi:magnesium transporter
MSFSEAKNDAEEPLGRTMSISSRRSLRSRTHADDADNRSFLTNKTAEEDVCYPLQEKHSKQNELRIDFDYLEDFIADERAERAARAETPAEGFKDLRRTSTLPKSQMATVDGDILEIPSDDSTANEKVSAQASEVPKMPSHPVDNTRFSFFSSAWESTIHAAEMGDLVLPGEDIRGLFQLPADESGVWWLNVNHATKEEVYGLGKAFGVHPLTIEDIVTQEAREKIELFPSYYFASFRSFNVVDEPDGKEYEPFNIYVIVFREGTLSFSFAPNSHASEVRKRITALKDYVSLSSDWICYALM